MIVTESGYLAYQVKSSIIIGLPNGCRKLTDAELTTLVLLVEKLMEEWKQNDQSIRKRSQGFTKKTWVQRMQKLFPSDRTIESLSVVRTWR